MGGVRFAEDGVPLMDTEDSGSSAISSLWQNTLEFLIYCHLQRAPKMRHFIIYLRIKPALQFLYLLPIKVMRAVLILFNFY